MKERESVKGITMLIAIWVVNPKVALNNYAIEWQRCKVPVNVILGIFGVKYLQLLTSAFYDLIFSIILLTTLQVSLGITTQLLNFENLWHLRYFI